MAVYDLQEQEQLEAFKAWWRQYGNWVLLAVLAGTLTFTAIVGWNYWQNAQAKVAGQLYGELEAALTSGDRSRARDISGMITTKYPHTGYAMLAALLGARTAEDIGDTATARIRLQWLVDNASDPATRDLARLRLAAVLLDEKQYPDALTLLEAAHAAIWDALYSNLKGDVLMAQGRRAEARAAYQIAIDKSLTQSPFRALVQAKLDAVGEGDTK